MVRGELYTHRADIYSFGVMMWYGAHCVSCRAEMFTIDWCLVMCREVWARCEPFIEKDYESLMELIRDIVINKVSGVRSNPRCVC